MNIRMLKTQDTKQLEEYLDPYKPECMFVCSNLKSAGIEYKGADFQGEYFGYFDKHGNHAEQLLGVIVHYWNGSIMMHASNEHVLDQLILHLKKNIKRPIEGILGPNIQAEHVITNLGLSSASFRINSNEGLYQMNLADLNDLTMPCNMEVHSAQNIPKSILIEWMKSYNVEALGASNDPILEQEVEEYWTVRLKKNDSWVLLLDGIPVALSALNARLTDIVQVGPVWTPPEYRNKGYARLLIAYSLHHEKLKGIKQAILFTENPAGLKAYISIGFKKIGDYRLALLKKSVRLEDIESKYQV